MLNKVMQRNKGLKINDKEKDKRAIVKSIFLIFASNMEIMQRHSLACSL